MSSACNASFAVVVSMHGLFEGCGCESSSLLLWSLIVLAEEWKNATQYHQQTQTNPNKRLLHSLIHNH
jgi:hypothetical protein